ncbi:hypothetical protein ACF0H5_005029 [Mactra antiquata]
MGTCKRTQQANTESACASLLTSSLADSIVIYTQAQNYQGNCVLDECNGASFVASLTNSTAFRRDCSRVCNNITMTSFTNRHVINAVPEVTFIADSRKNCTEYCIEVALDGIRCAAVHKTNEDICEIFLYTSCSAHIFQHDLQSYSTIDYLTCNISLPPRCCSLPLPQNGNVTYTGLEVGGIATYLCNTGFSLSLNDTRTCQTNLTWTGNQPTCDAVSCGPPISIANGSFTLTLSQTVTYTCDTGYTLWGIAEITCGSDGLWRDVPTCNITDCGHPLTIPNGDIINVTSTLYQSSIIYTCDVGFTMLGLSTRYCANDGNWTSIPPNCIIVDCGAPSSIANGFVDVNNTTYQEIAHYSCNSGYILSGNSSRTCQEDGQWSESEPYCIIDCVEPPSIAQNGTVAYNDTLDGSLAIYMCDDGCEMTGENQTTCLSNGFWSNTAPNCSCSIQCEAVSDPTNGYVNISDDTNGATLAIYSCLSDYVLYGNSNITCTPAGVWSSEPPTCRLRDPVPIFLMPCVCNTGESAFSNMTQEEIVVQLIKDTQIDVKKTAKAQQKLHCIDDSRQSSLVIGTVGILFISIVFGVIVLLDGVSIVFKCQNKRTNDHVRNFRWNGKGTL